MSRLQTNDDNFEIDADLMEAVNSIVDEQVALEDAHIQNGTTMPITTDENKGDNIDELRKTVSEMKNQIEVLMRMLGEKNSRVHTENATASQHSNPTSEDGQIIEGVFDGQSMIAEDGRSFPIPPNYASKSKLVEGDMMKLTITPSGSFLYKQIGPTERKRLRGELIYDLESTKWSVLAEGRPYKVLTASVTFYKGKPGDEATLLVPQNGESEWGAIEHIIGITR